MDSISIKKAFCDQIFDLHANKSAGHMLYTKDEIENIISEVESAKAKISSKTSKDYRRLERFDVMQIGSTKQLNGRVQQRKRKCVDDENGEAQGQRPSADSIEQRKLLPVCALENLFDILFAAHRNSEHAGRDRMLMDLREQYANITRESVEIFLKLL